MKANNLSVSQIGEAYKKNELKPSELVKAYQDSYLQQKNLNCYIEFYDEAYETALNLEKAGPSGHHLWAVPAAVKDNFSVQGKDLTCASKILEGYVSPSDAVVVSRLKEQNFINLGRLNMDEMAMGATGRYSVYGPTLNFLDNKRFAGGSSSGSAVAVAAGMAAFALASDTGGSARLPASYNGLTGFKPSYGVIPRSGMADLAPSLDVVGLIAHTPLDIKLVLEAVAGRSNFDETSINLNAAKQLSFKGLKVARFNNLLKPVHPEVKKAFSLAEEYLKSEGVIFVDIDLGLEDEIINIYYILCCGEAATTLSRFDGARYGLKLKAASAGELFAATRSKGFGDEVKRRILLGNYFLHEQNYADWYNKANVMRSHLCNKINELKQSGVELFLLPGFSEAPLIGTADEATTYSSDSTAVMSNLTGTPAVAVPMMLGQNGLPVSVQLGGLRGSDQLVLDAGQKLYHIKNY
ncbi:MAG: amidase family protein [Spirochaetaceae bacterium]|nr:amidase family protein [Spirochaetaceae bacterium]